ncbi:MAG: glycosyltransferase [Fusobacteriaceae bacterium]
MKRILFKTGYMGLGAIEQLAFDMICHLSKEYEVILAIENELNNHLVEKLPKNIKYFYLKEKSFIKEMKELRKNKTIFNRLKYNFLLSYEKIVCYKKINKWIKKNGKVDLFIDYDGMSMKYAEKINIDKKVVWQHTSLSNYKNLDRLEKRILKYNKVILICDEMKDEYIQKFPELKDKFVRLYNFIDINRIQKMADDKKELTFEDKELQKNNYCISIARLDEPKDFKTLIQSFEILKKSGIDEKLYIIGEGELRSEIESQIKESSLEDTIFLLGKKMNPYTWLKNSRIFVHSSKREGFPAVLLEALASKRMVVSSECSTGPREILGAGEYGELYKVGDYKNLALILKKVLKDDKLRVQYAEKGFSRVKEFHKDKVLEEYTQFLKELLA